MASSQVWVDPDRISHELLEAVPEEMLMTAPSPIAPLKSRKNTGEVNGMLACHVLDGAALAEFFAWLEETLRERPVSECEVADVLRAERANTPESVESLDFIR